MKMRERPISRILSRGLPLMDDHSSDHAVTDTATAANPDLLERKKLRRHARRHRSTRSLFGVAPGGACHAAAVASRAVGSYPTVSPLPDDDPKRTLSATGGLFSVALSVGLPRPGITRHLFLLESGLSSPLVAQRSGHPAFRANMRLSCAG